MRSRIVPKRLAFHVKALFCVIAALIVAGCLLWDRLPPEAAVHFSYGNQLDSYATRPFAALGISRILLGLQGVCVAAVREAPVHARHIADAVGCIVPIIVACVLTLLYSHALGQQPGFLISTQFAFGATLVTLILPKNAASVRCGLRARELPRHVRQKIARFHRYCLVLRGPAVFINVLASTFRWLFVIVCAAIALPTAYARICCRHDMRTSPP